MKNLLYVMLLLSLIPMAFSGEKVPESDDYDFWYEDITEATPDVSAEGEECPQNTLSNGSKPFEVSCKPSWKKEKYCRCVRAEAENNVFVKINLTNPKEPLDAIEKNQIHNTKRFVNAYSQMTIEADLQEQILGLDLNPPGSKIANCAPQDFAEKVKINTKEHFDNQALLLEDMKTKRIKALKECESEVTKKIAKGKAGQNSLNEQIGKCSKLKHSIETINANLPPVGNTGVQAGYECAVAATRLTKIALKKRLDIALAYYTKIGNPDKIKETNGMLETIEISEQFACFAPGSSPSELATTFLVKFDEVYGADGGMTNRKDQCDKIEDRSTKDLCLALENTNTVLADELKTRYDFNPKSDCISFAEFKTFKGMPGKDLLNAFTSATRFFPGDLLETPENGSDPLKEQRLNFLRSNPLIAKLAQNDDSRKALGQMLRKLGKSLHGKNDFEKFNAYLAFMKDEKSGLKSLLMNSTKAETTNMFICNQLIKNFTAIQVSNDLPQPVKDKDEDVFEGNLRKIKACQIEEHNEVSLTKLEETLKASPIFSLASPDPEGEKKKIQEEFDTFKGKYCADYEEKYAGYTGTPEERRQQFLDQSPFGGYKKALDTNGVPATANINWPEARKSTSEARQDKVLQAWWDKSVGSKLSKSPIMLKGQEDKFLEDQLKDKAIASSAASPSSASAAKLAGASTSGGSKSNQSDGSIPATGTPTVVHSDRPKTGQQIPEYAQVEPPVDLSKAATAKNIPEMIPDYENKSLEEKEQSLEEAKEFLSEQAPELLEKFPLDEEIKKLEKKIAQGEGEKAKTEDKGANKFFNNMGLTPQESGNSIGTGSTTNKSVVSKDKKGYGKENDAIVSLHEQGLKDGKMNPGRSPSGLEPIIVTSNTVIDFETGKIQPSTIQEELKTMSILVAESPAEFDKIFANVGDLNKFIGEKLQGQTIEFQVIKIKDPVAEPEKFLLFAVSTDVNGHLKVKSIDRLYTAKGLHGNFK